jgi:hypothetical protein
MPSCATSNARGGGEALALCWPLDMHNPSVRNMWYTFQRIRCETPDSAGCVLGSFRGSYADVYSDSASRAVTPTAQAECGGHMALEGRFTTHPESQRAAAPRTTQEPVSLAGDVTERPAKVEPVQRCTASTQLRIA